MRVNHVEAFATKTHRGQGRDAADKGKGDGIIGRLEPVTGGEAHDIVGIVFVVGKARREHDDAMAARAQFERGRVRRSDDAVFRGQISVAEKSDVHESSKQSGAPIGRAVV